MDIIFNPWSIRLKIATGAARRLAYLQWKSISKIKGDDPTIDTFERCSTDSFTIWGPCVYSACYLYLMCVGSDQWKPEWVRVYYGGGQYVSFFYDVFIPTSIWYGFNLCNSLTATQSALSIMWDDRHIAFGFCWIWGILHGISTFMACSEFLGFQCSKMQRALRVFCYHWWITFIFI